MNAVLHPIASKHLEIFQTLSDDERDTVTQALASITQQSELDTSAEDSLAKSITGKTYSRQERIELEVETLARHFAHRRALLEGALTAPEVARLFGTSRQTPHDRLKSQSLIGIKHNGKLMFPLWQFDPAGPDGVIEGLPETLKALCLSDYAKLNWLTRPSPYLDSLTPIELLKRGELDRVLEEAFLTCVEDREAALVPA